MLRPLVALLVAWLAFPLLLAALSLGCGRLLEATARTKLPGPLVLPVGLTVVILVGEFTTLSGSTARFAGPLVAALAGVGLLLRPPWRVRAWRWPTAAAASAFAVYAAPVVLSGRATFAGYIKLDDTATYLAMTDRVMEHGRSLAGLAPSTYQETLATTLKLGYPTGSLIPLGIGHQLLAYDVAWLFQPFLAFLAAMLALTLYALLDGLVPSSRWRAGAAFLAAQPAILFGYALWGGIKEMAGAWLLALVAALAGGAVVPLAAACAALVCVLSLPGAVWLVPGALAVTIVYVLRPEAVPPRKAAAFAAAAAVLAVPAVVASVDWLPRIGAFGKESELGNLFGRLSVLQLFGIWPGGDFRTRHDSAFVDLLIALVILAALLSVWWAWTRGDWALLLYLAIAGIGCAGFIAASSPWVGGKSLAVASPAFLAAALAACHRGRAVGAVVAAAIAGGVLWSNWDQYHDVWLAPRGQLHELETIGDRFAGDGPALMTDYETYGARHFLRRADPEGASELRRRFVYLTNGTTLAKGLSADIDRFRLDGILVYRTLVLRRGPAASRPPSVYRLAWRGRYYEVWQRRSRRRIVEHLGLGGTRQAAAAPPCAEVLRLARLPGVRELATATRPRTIWATSRVELPSDGVYTTWLGGDWRGLATIAVDGRKLGSRREELNWPGLFTDLGSARLTAGPHVVTLNYVTGGWRPGSGANPTSFGPTALTPEDAREPVETVRASQARSLCGRRLDWVEALR